MKHRTSIVCLFVMLSLLGCSRNQRVLEPTVDMPALEATVAARIFATLTAAAPTALLTSESMVTPQPTTTAAGTVEASPTAPPTPILTSTLIPVAPTVPAPTLTPTAQPAPEGPTVIVQVDTLNVRAGPGTNHPVIASAKRGTGWPATGRNQDATWVEIMLPEGQKGWVASQFVQVSVVLDAVPLVSQIPTPPPVQVAAPPLAQTSKPDQKTTARDLEVTFINMHYECQQQVLEFEPVKGLTEHVWGYRSFQVDMYIKNNGNTPVEPPWNPKRWIITDGNQEYVSDLMWQWIDRRSGAYKQPIIGPGQMAGWTFIASPIDRNQWVKAVEFEWNNQLYRQEFELGPWGNAYNYKDCGEPILHPFLPTPTPRP